MTRITRSLLSLTPGCTLRTLTFLRLWFLGLVLGIAPAIVHAVEYQSSNTFLNETFNGTPPAAKILWLTGQIGQTAGTIMGRPPAALRTRYWLKDGRSAWILEEIGKEQPITVGLVVNQGRLESIKVLAFRESRGDEVRHDFFTRQFKNASLKPDNRLDRTIDGISGATMSANALTKLARLALYLHQQAGS